MKKLSLNLDALQVQSFETVADRMAETGTVHGFGKKTGIDDTNCSAIDACASARGCTEIFETCMGCEETNTCESYNDACPTGRGCTPLFPC
ncbi:MAG TPA: hypothetical protein VFY65_03230 [Longimicrobium sp.]|nr:hypothetical protein [Longimicrobium sp.]